MATASKPSGSQFDGLLAQRKRPAVAPPAAASVHSEPPPPPQAAADAQLPTLRAEGKAVAKSRDQAYQGRTFYVRKKTYAECDYILKTTDDPRDMSDLVEELLAVWHANPPKR